MFSHSSTHRVRYGETDQMGYLYYGNYPLLYEIGRVEMLRSIGLSYAVLELRHKIMMPVMSLNIRYVRPAHYDDLLTITTTLRKLPEQTITFHIEIYNQAEELINGGTVKLCFVHTERKHTVPPPEILLEKLRPYFG